MTKEYRLTAEITDGKLVIAKQDGSNFEFVATPVENAAKFPVFGFGTHSPAVAVVQALLNYYGAKLVIDGQYGLATRSALFDFKSARGLAVNTQVSRETWAKLLEG